MTPQEKELRDRIFLKQLVAETIPDPHARNILMELQKIYFDMDSLDTEIKNLHVQKHNCFSAEEAYALEADIQEKVSKKSNFFLLLKSSKLAKQSKNY